MGALVPDSKFFGIPFALSGDKATIPEGTQPSGAISMTQGFGPDYERDPATDPLAKRVPRDETNELYYQITNSMRILQLFGVGEWYEEDDAGNPVSYSTNARVRHAGTVWASIADTNTAEPGTDPTKWVIDQVFNMALLEASIGEAQAGVVGDKIITPRRLASVTATTTRRGLIEIATNVETAAGADAERAVVPAGMEFALFNNPGTTRGKLGLAIGSDVQAFNQNLWNLRNVGNGITVSTGSDTWAARTIVGTGGEISVGNGNGIAGNPTISLPNALSFSGKTVAGGTFNGLTIQGNTFENPIFTYTGAVGSDVYLAYWGWNNSVARWRLRYGTDATLTFWAFNSSGGSVGSVLALNNSTRAATLAANLLVQGGITSVLQVTFQSNLNVLGSLSKGSGTFLIDDPLDPANRDLLHGFVEAPEYQNRYRGLVKLVDGQAVVNIDAAWSMAPGTFAAINQDVWVESLQNQDGFTRLRPSKVVNGEFTIFAEDPECADEVAWSVSAARADPFVKSGLDPNTDANGRLIISREKPDAEA